MPASLTRRETGIMLVTFAGPFASLFLRDINHEGALTEIYPHLIESLVFGSLNYFKVIIKDVGSIKIMVHFLFYEQVIAIIADYCTRGKEEDH
jgi:hypothetical protein